MDITALARALPKIDLHCHLLGAIDRDTALGLVAGNTAGVTEDQVRAAYSLQDLDRDGREPAFFEALDLIGLLLETPDALASAVRGLVTHNARTSGLRYLELAVNPTVLMRGGMTFAQVRDGLVDGARAAKQEVGVTTNFIAAIMRDEPVAMAEQLLDELIEHRTDEFVGIGLDGPESAPEHEAIRFAEVFQRAKRNGLRRTAHYCQFGPSRLPVYLDDLACERIDHGYPAVEDPAMLRRAADSGTAFTVCPTITMQLAPDAQPQYQQGSTHPIRTLEANGVWIVPGTDDGALVSTDLAAEYAVTAQWCGWDAEALTAAALRSVDASWLDETDRAALRTSMRAEIDALALDRVDAPA